eukprot:scaffold146_cov374-Prasinococcus_capsulatus_cf.AAC.15
MGYLSCRPAWTAASEAHPHWGSRHCSAYGGDCGCSGGPSDRPAEYCPRQPRVCCQSDACSEWHPCSSARTAQMTPLATSAALVAETAVLLRRRRSSGRAGRECVSMVASSAHLFPPEELLLGQIEGRGWGGAHSRRRSRGAEKLLAAQACDKMRPQRRAPVCRVGQLLGAAPAGTKPDCSVRPGGRRSHL